MSGRKTDYPAVFQKVDNIVFDTIRAISYISGVCIVGIMFVAFFNVLGEKLFKYGIPMSTEIIQYLHIPVVFLAAAYVTLDNGHTKIDLLSSRFPQKAQAFFTAIGYMLGAFICGFIAFRGFVQMGKFFTRHKMSSTSGIGFPLWPFAFVLSVGFVLFSLSFLWSIARQFAGGYGKVPDKREKEDAE